MKKSKRTKSNDPVKILRMISRDEDLERRDGKFQRKMVHRDKTKYNRNTKQGKSYTKELDSCFSFIAA